MQVNIVKNEGLEKHYKVIVSSELIQEKITSNLKDIAKTYKMPGFRPGKVPQEFILKKHGNALRLEVIENQLKDSISKIITDNNLELATEPEIEPKLSEIIKESEKDLEFTLKLETLPEVSLPDFKKIKLEKLVPIVTEADVDKEIKKFAEKFKEFKKASSKTKAKKGDQLLISFEGFIDNKAFEGGKSENHELELGSNSFIEGFEDQLIGAKEGDEKTIKVTFPENYNFKEIAGKLAEFVVIIKEVRQPQIPEINEELLKKINIENIEKLRDKLTEEIKNSYAESINTIMKVKLFDQLENELTFPIPPSLVKREYGVLWNQLQEIRVMDENIKDKDEKELEIYYQKIAARRVRVGLMLAEYAKRQKINITSNELNAAIYQQARMFPSNPKLVFDYYQQNPKAIESLKGPIIENKAVKMIFDQEIVLNIKEYKLPQLDKIIEEENDKEVI